MKSLLFYPFLSISSLNLWRAKSLWYDFNLNQEFLNDFACSYVNVVFFQVHVRFGQRWRFWSYLRCRTAQMHQKFINIWRPSEDLVKLRFWHNIKNWVSFLIPPFKVRQTIQKLCSLHWRVVYRKCERKMSKMKSGVERHSKGDDRHSSKISKPKDLLKFQEL